MNINYRKIKFNNGGLEAYAALAIAIFVLLFFAYIHRQYVDIIFESQFLHIKFLRDIGRHQLIFENFFSIYGEHLFPGYNLLFAINYYLFGLWGGFDYFIFIINQLATVWIVIIAIQRSALPSARHSSFIALICAFLLLSPTNNPMSGMALAASIGVSLFLLSLLEFGSSLEADFKTPKIFPFVAISVAILFFLGGYAIGVIPAISFIMMVFVYRNRKIDSNTIKIAGTILISLLTYVLIYSYIRGLSKFEPSLGGSNYGDIGRFLLVMTGSSLLGKAFFEVEKIILPYYLCGALLLFWMPFLFRDFIVRPSKGRMFFLALYCYSIAITSVVSIFRFKNGLDGAMGQWYNAHTHFFAVATAFYLISTLKRNSFSLGATARLASLILLMMFGLIGYYYDWKKSPYIPVWKERFLMQAPVLLAFPETIKDKSDPFNTMLWNYEEAKLGIDFIYENKLWIFKDQRPFVVGLEPDGWMIAGRNVMILCPSDSSHLQFLASRPDEWPKPLVSIKLEGKVVPLNIDGGEFSYKFIEGKAAVLIQSGAMNPPNPLVANGDTRSLVININSISCK